MLDYYVLVIDPRAEYADGWDLKHIQLDRGMPDDVLAAASLDGHSAVVALTHDPKIDDLALMVALKSPAFYVGAIGSKKNNDARRLRLKEFDLSESGNRAAARAVGLYIGSKTPPEIAVAILAEMTAVRHGVSEPNWRRSRPRASIPRPAKFHPPSRRFEGGLRVVAILLAAGSASRFGSDKLLHLLPHGVPIAVQSARHLRAVFEGGVFAVVRPEAAALSELLQKEGCKVVPCEHAADGMGASLACGVRAAGTVDAYVVALADMPFIRPSSIEAVREELLKGAVLAAPYFRARRGHPVGISSRFRDELVRLQGDEGAKTLLTQHAAEIAKVPVGDPAVLRDIDTPGDLAPAARRIVHHSMETAQRAVLFVDVTDSTKLYESLGDTVALALINGVFARLDKVIAKYAGLVVKTLGDGMICVFEDPDNAFRAACEIQTTVHAAAQGTRRPARQLKVGFTYGPVILSKGDVFGDTMNVCSRLVVLANPEQILTSAQTVDALTPGLRARCRVLFPTRIKGKAEEVAVSEVMWRYDPAVTETNLTRADFAKAVQMSLKLIYRGNIFVVSRSRPTLQMGREDSNDIVIASLSPRACMRACTTREGHFVITDLSSNGTFLLVDEHSNEVHLRREEAVLGGRGWIGLGKNATRHGDHSVRYSLQAEGV